jgi:hypothetical protein
VDDQGERRWLGITLVAKGDAEAPKVTRILLRGTRGVAHLANMPIAAGDARDLQLFLRAVRHRGDGPGLSAARLLMLAEQFLDATAT